jgi:hypothetical protein
LIQLTVLALLAGNTTLVAIAHFGRSRGAALGHALGFRNGQMPCANTFANLFRVLDAERLDALLGAWLLQNDTLATSPIAIDGKVLRGSKDGQLPALHLLAAYVPHAAAVIAQVPVGAKTNEHKAALRLLGLLPPLQGRLVTADAMFTQRDFAEKVREAGGNYLLYAKENQTQARNEIAYNFQAARYGQFSPLAAEAVASGGSHRDDPLPEVARSARDTNAHGDDLECGSSGGDGLARCAANL